MFVRIDALAESPRSTNRGRTYQITTPLRDGRRLLVVPLSLSHAIDAALNTGDGDGDGHLLE